jgi:hypothetical protein
MYPSVSPNVVAVGGTTLTLNADNSYKGEVGWGSYSNALGVFFGSGGGLSQYEAEPAFQQGVQSTGSRTAPDVSLLSDPATGAWIADPYNLGSDNPWGIVGGTSLSAPAWGALFALVNQGRVASGKATLGSAGPTEAQTALYGLNQADYHDVTTGSNGYSAGAGYDLVSGLGSPVADLLVPDLVAYAGGPPSSTPVAPITAAGLVLSQEVGSVSDTVAALTRAAALRVFSAQAIGSGVPGLADHVPAAAPGRSASAVGSGPSAPVDAGARPAAATPVGQYVAAEVAPLAGRIVAPAAGGGNGPSPSAGAAPAWSAVLLDTASATGSVPARMADALRPEMPAHDAADVLLGGAGDDLTVGGEGRDVLVGGYSSVGTEPLVTPDVVTRAPDTLTAGDADGYFARIGQGDDEADVAPDAP